MLASASSSFSSWCSADAINLSPAQYHISQVHFSYNSELDWMGNKLSQTLCVGLELTDHCAEIMPEIYRHSDVENQ